MQRRAEVDKTSIPAVGEAVTESAANVAAVVENKMCGTALAAPLFSWEKDSL